MKLFIWNNPYRVPYGSSMLVAVAKDEEAARFLAKKSPAYVYGEFGNGDAPQSLELGPPTRVLELPAAEWHEWHE